MKKTILNIAILLSIFAVLATSCGKDEDDNLPQLEGEYNVAMNGNTVASGKTEEVGMIGNAISLSVGEDFGLLISGVPESVGGEAIIGNGSEASVTITGKNLLGNGETEMYFSISGTVKRSSASKITFEGTCSDLTGTTVHTFSGTAESDIYKVI
jgi:hypothetical protein